MPRSAAAIIQAASQRAKTPLYAAQALDELNSLLRFIEDTIDFSAARGQWNFFFNTQLVTSGAGNIIQTAGVPLPIDYLRVQVSGGSTGAQRSSKWYFQGVPYDMVEVDLTEFDDQVQQAGIQSYPYFWAKDLAQYQPIIEITGDAVAPETVTNLAIAADALSPNSIGNLGFILPGMSIAGGYGGVSPLRSGCTITAVTGSPPTSLTLSSPDGNPPIVKTVFSSSFLTGLPGLGLMYPPPSGAFPAMIRYQRRMPRLTQAQVNSGVYPWFSDNDLALTVGLTGLLCQYSDDSRAAEFIGSGLVGREPEKMGAFGQLMAKHLKLADDNAGRAQTVQLDRRAFGKSFSSLKNTKAVGW